MDLEEPTSPWRQGSEPIFDEAHSGSFNQEASSSLRPSTMLAPDKKVLESAYGRPSLSHLLSESLELP